MHATRQFAEAVAPGVPKDHWVPWRSPGLLAGPVRKGAVITGAAVAAGFVCATALLPDVPTPDHVAEAYMEARFEEDWSAAWDLICERTRSRTTFARFEQGAAYVNEYYFVPTDVDVETGRLERTPYRGETYVTVTFRVTSDQRGREDWVFDGELPLLHEGSGFRVCLPEDALTP